MGRLPVLTCLLLAAHWCALEAAATNCAAGNPNTTSIAESTPSSTFTVNADGSVTHLLTGLIWKRCVQGTSGANCATGSAAAMTWTNALLASVADHTGGHTDWRLPNSRELESILEFCGYSPAINQSIFPATPSSQFWSATSLGYAPEVAWSVQFDNGLVATAAKAGSQYVRLVRGGGAAGAFDASLPLASSLDVDGNGVADALTDGLLALRYLFGFRGAILIQGAIGQGATRSTALQIENYLKTVVPSP